MKRVIGFVAIALIATTGCELFGSAVKKEEKKEEKPPPPPAVPQIDPLTYVYPPPVMSIGKEGKVGYAVVVETEAAGNKTPAMYAIVNETDEVWHIETTQGLSANPQLKDYLMGLVVNKADGKVTKAFAGKPGEDVKELKINPLPEQPKTDAPESTEVEVTLSTAAGGPHKVMKTVSGDYTSYVGVDGPIKGITVKLEGPDPKASYELEKLPEDGEIDCGGTKVAVKKYAFTNGTQAWYTENAVVAALQPAGINNWGAAARVGAGFSTTVVKLAEDHKKELKWE